MSNEVSIPKANPNLNAQGAFQFMNRPMESQYYESEYSIFGTPYNMPLGTAPGNFGTIGGGMMMPGMGMKTGDLGSMVDEKQLARMEAIVLSMTPAERKNPKLLNPQRKFRIAKGAGVDIAVVNRFIKQFEQSQKLMKQFGGGKRKGFGGFPGMAGKGRFPF